MPHSIIIKTFISFLSDSCILYSLQAKLQSIMRSQGFFECLPPIDGAVDAVKEMMMMPG